LLNWGGGGVEGTRGKEENHYQVELKKGSDFWELDFHNIRSNGDQGPKTKEEGSHPRNWKGKKKVAVQKGGGERWF